ncbi:winged helix-turn-helix domain-containing protein, partial [Streptomyces sp. NPDC006624]
MFIAQGVGRFVVHAYALVGRQCLPDPARLASAVGSIRFRRASPCVAAALRRRAPQRGSTTVLSASALEYFRIGDWIVYPRENVLARAGERVAIEPRAMETLEFLAYHAGAVVSADRLLAECWPNIEIGDNPVHKAIAQLRKAMGDQASSPRYIETIRKR